MDKASGVYLTITDNSFLNSTGVQPMNIVIPMLTTKGKLGINRVTAKSFEEVLGYDMNYNSNYYGLRKLLENVSYVDVWRLNQEAKMANAYFESSTSDKSFDENCESFEDIIMKDPQPVLALSQKNVGDYQTTCVKFLPTTKDTTQANENPNISHPQTITFDDVSETEKRSIGQSEVYNGCVFYDSSDSDVVGVIKDNLDGSHKVYKVVDGEVIDDEIVYNYTDTWSDGTTFYNSSANVMLEPSGEAYKTVSIGTVRRYGLRFYQKATFELWFQVKGFTSTGVALVTYAETDATIISALNSAQDINIDFIQYRRIDNVINNSIGDAQWDGTQLTVVLINQMSKDSFWNIHTIPSTITEWTMNVAKYENNKYLIQNTYNFSTNSESDIYWEKVEFEEVNLFLKGAISETMTIIRDYFTLDGGSNGLDSPVASEIDTTVLDSVNDNILLMNGIVDYKVVNRIATKCQSKKIRCFVDCPAYKSYIDAETWCNKILRGEYIAIGAVPDIEEDSTGKEFYVYPSINYGLILANMMRDFGSFCYPPAGPTYGIISANNLLETDFRNYANELKTNRINYQTSNSLGSMMWEQRTTYSLNTDLSYIAPVFIVDALSEEIVAFERQFNFRYMTPTDLLTQDTGLRSIFDNFVAKNFVYAYQVDVPTFEEAQRSGRTLVIPMKVQIMKDAEVIELQLELTNSL